jgi:hypothetical protein
VVARCCAGQGVLGSACVATSGVCQGATGNSLRIDGGSGYASTCTPLGRDDLISRSPLCCRTFLHVFTFSPRTDMTAAGGVARHLERLKRGNLAPRSGSPSAGVSRGSGQSLAWRGQAGLCLSPRSSSVSFSCANTWRKCSSQTSRPSG